jgi:hypothetical protein
MRERYQNVTVRMIQKGWGNSIGYQFEKVIDGDSFTTPDGITAEIVNDRLHTYNKASGRSLSMTITSEQVDGVWLYVLRFSE